MVLSSSDEVGLADLPAQVGATPPAAAVTLGGAVSLKDLEKEHIRRILVSTSSLQEAAIMLDIDPSTLYRKRRDYGL